jgi:competence protein ComEC
VYLSEGHGNALLAACFSLRRSAAGHLSRGIEDSPRSVSLLYALLLGYRAHLQPEIRELFAVTGTLHIFAISGLHVGVMAAIGIFVLQASRVSRVHWILFLGPFLVAYTVATGMKASAVRACIMALIYWLAPLVGRRSDAVSALSCAAVLIVVVAPGQLLARGFILSFVVVTGLLLLYPGFVRPLLRRLAPDPFRLQPERKWVGAARGCARRAAELCAASAAAWLASAPLSAYFFHVFSPVALVGNLLVIPLAFMIVLGGCLSVLFGGCVPLLAEVFNHANHVLISVLVTGVGAMARVPGGHIEVARPSLLWVVAWYAAVSLVSLVLNVDIRSRAGYNAAVRHSTR